MEGGEIDALDDSSQTSDSRVSVMDPKTGEVICYINSYLCFSIWFSKWIISYSIDDFIQILKGEDAPLLSQLKDWMETHPGWEVLSDSEDSGDDSQDDDGKYFSLSAVILCERDTFS